MYKKKKMFKQENYQGIWEMKKARSQIELGEFEIIFIV